MREQQYNDTFYPFTTAPVAGQDWKIASLDSLPKLPQGKGPGFGCLVMPESQVGYPLIVINDDADDDDIQLQACKPGFFCPYFDPDDRDTIPVACPPTTTCESSRLAGRTCLPQGTFEPMACPAGFYCPDFKTVTVCPSGSFCPTGTWTPLKCQFLSACPAGSVAERHYGLLVLVVVVDILMLLLYVVMRQRELKMRGLPWTAMLPRVVAVVLFSPLFAKKLE